VKLKIRAFVMTSGAFCTAALPLIVLGWTVVHAAPQDIILQSSCSINSQPQLSYAAKVGDKVEDFSCPGQKCSKIGVTNAGVEVYWDLGVDAVCQGNPTAVKCGPFFFVTTPTAQDVPASVNEKVKITGTVPLNADAGQWVLTAQVTNADQPNVGSPQCTRKYLLRVSANGGGWGDPHITTVDGVHYDFQSAGEFTALKEDEFEIQTRQKPVPTATVPGPTDYTGLGVCVSIYSAVAARIGSNRISLQPNLSGEPDPNGLQLRVNGKLVTLTDSGIDLRAGGSTDPSLPLEGRITKAPGGAYEFTDVRGTQLVATPAYWDAQRTWYLNLNVYQTSATQGIWGRLADDSWLPALPDGTSLGQKPTALDARYEHLYVRFADAWRVDNATSLFDYAPGTNTETFTVRDWPGFEPRSCLIPGQTPAEPTDPQTAAEACSGITDRNQYADCVFDVEVTGHKGFAESYKTMQEFQPHGTGWQPALVASDVQEPTRPDWTGIIIMIPR
jgi:hypothetical protein